MSYRILVGDVREKLKELPDESVQMCVTSPPYWSLRDYGHPGQIGLERTPEEYVATMVEVFREVRRVLKNDGTLWLNLGDSYAGSGGQGSHYDNKSAASFKREFKKYDNPNKKVLGIKPKDLVGIPWMVAFALRADGWYLRCDIIWHKPNPMPSSVTDRPTRAHEYIFLMSKSLRYFYDAGAIAEQATSTDESERDRDASRLNNTPGRTRMGGLTANHYTTRNRRSVWSINTRPYREAHFATFPPDLIEPCIRAGSKEGDTVLDPFVGSGTTCEVSERLGRNSIGIELNEKYVQTIIGPRMESVNPLFQ